MSLCTITRCVVIKYLEWLSHVRTKRSLKEVIAGLKNGKKENKTIQL